MSQENVALARKAYKRLGDGSVALFADGKLVRGQGFGDREEALEAAGLAE